MKNKGLKLSTAESCTGGLLAHYITNVPGSSAYFDRGVIVYSNQAKEELLGVDRNTLIKYGAVSRQTVVEMAEGVRRMARSDIGVAITGIAGPDGGTKNKPVGLVFIALSTQEGTFGLEHNFSGTREEIKKKSAIEAIKIVCDYFHCLQ